MGEINYEVLQRPFPREAIKQRKGGNGKYLNYVEAHTVIRRIIEATGNDFNFRVLNVDFRDGLILATVEMELAGSKRQHVGTQRMNGGMDDDVVKAAISDGFKKAATLFGVALELYCPDSETAPAVAPRPAQNVPQGNNGGNGNGGSNGGGYRRANQVRSGFRPLQSQA